MNLMSMRFRDWKLILQKPTEYFSSLNPEELSNRELFGGMFCLGLGAFFAAVTQIYLLDVMSELKAAAELVPAAQMVILRKEAFYNLLASPFVGFFGVYLLGGGVHWILKALCKPEVKLRYDTTLRLVALCQIPMLASVIPLIGPMIATVWGLVLMMKALRQVYGIPGLMAFVAIALPALFLKYTWGSALQTLALSL